MMDYNRNLVAIEQALERLNQNKGTFNVVTISKLSGKLNPDILRQALDQAQSVHPRLQSRIVRLENKLHFITEGTAKIPLRIVITNEPEAWQEIVTEELNQMIDSSQCLLRCVLIEDSSNNYNSYLITTIHHAITDAISSIHLQSSLLKFYESLISGHEIELIPLNVLPPLDELLPRWMQGNQGFFQEIIFILKMQWKLLVHKSEVLAAESTVPLQIRHCGIATRYLEKDLTQTLIQVCRQKNTTVQGAICAAMLITVGEKIRKGLLKNINLSCRSFVSLRERITPRISPENMGCMVSFVTSFHTINYQTLFWDLAREVTDQIQAQIKNKDIFKPLKAVKKIIDYYLNQPDKLSLTVSVTNVGRVDIPNRYGNLELEEISFIFSNVTFGRVFTVAVTTFQDQMILNFIASQPSIQQETINYLANGVIQLLTQVCYPGKNRGISIA